MAQEHAKPAPEKEKKPETLLDKVKQAARDAAKAAAVQAKADGKSDLDVRGAAWGAARATIPVAYEREVARLGGESAVSEADKKAMGAWDWAKDAADVVMVVVAPRDDGGGGAPPAPFPYSW